MKKLISLILVLCAVCLLVPATAEEDISGEWYGSLMGMPVNLVLNADGKASMEMAGQKTENVTWTLDGEKFTLTVEGSTNEGTYANGTLTVMENGQRIEFTREPVQAITVAEANPDAKAEDYNGEWKITYVKMEDMILDASSMGESLPNITIENSTIKFSENDTMAMMFGKELPLTFENGALGYSVTLADDATGGIAVSLKAEMLQDGLLALTLDMGSGASVMYYSKVTAE